MLIGIVELVLEPGGDGHHGEVVSVGDGVDIPGQTQGELGHGDEEGVSAPGGGALYVEGGAGGGLADAPPHVLPPFGQPFDEAQGGGGLPLPQGRGGDGGDLDVFPVGTVLQALVDLGVVELGYPPVGDDLFFLEPEPFRPLLGGGHVLLRLRRDLPVGEPRRIVRHLHLLIRVMDDR